MCQNTRQSKILKTLKIVKKIVKMDETIHKTVVSSNHWGISFPKDSLLRSNYLSIHKIQPSTHTSGECNYVCGLRLCLTPERRGPPPPAAVTHQSGCLGFVGPVYLSNGHFVLVVQPTELAGALALCLLKGLVGREKATSAG